MVHVPHIRIRTRETKDGRGRVYLDYEHQGHRYRETVGPNTARMRELAKQVAAKRAYDIASGLFLGPTRPQRMTFEAFTEEYLRVHVAKKRSARRIRGIVRHLVGAFGPRDLQDITSVDVERYQTERRREVAPATVNRELAILKNIYSKAIAWGKLIRQTNPVKGVEFIREDNERTRYLTRPEAASLLAECSPMVRRVVTFALHTGARKSEILALQWRDVDFAAGTVRIREGKSPRIVPLNGTARGVLEELPRSMGGHVFLNTRGNEIDESSLHKAFTRARRRAGIEDFHFHDLRHTFASWMVMAGESLETVREILGHTTLAMTQRYAHLSPDHKARAVRVLDDEGHDTVADTEGRADRNGRYGRRR